MKRLGWLVLTGLAWLALLVVIVWLIGVLRGGYHHTPCDQGEVGQACEEPY